MIFTAHHSLGVAPQLMALTTLVFNIVVMLLLYAHTTATVPLVQVDGAHGTAEVRPMEVTEEYGVTVGTEFIKTWYHYLPDTFVAHRSYGLSFLDPSLTLHYQQVCEREWPIIQTTNKAQRVSILSEDVYSFDPKVGISIVFKVELETYYNGLEYGSIQKRVVMSLVNSPPDDRNAYLLRVIYLDEQQLTME